MCRTAQNLPKFHPGHKTWVAATEKSLFYHALSAENETEKQSEFRKNGSRSNLQLPAKLPIYSASEKPAWNTGKCDPMFAACCDVGIKMNTESST